MAKILLFPRAGLANRLMCILSGLRLARIYNLDFRIAWELDHHLFASPEHLFNNTKNFTEATNHDGGLYFNVSDKLATIPKAIFESGSDIAIESNHFFFTDADLLLPRSEIISQLRNEFFALGISKKVSNELEKFNGIDFSNGIGLHIRRPFPNWELNPDLSREKIFLNPSDDQYISIARKIIDAGFNGAIYLATNSNETLDYISRKLNRVFFNPATSFNNSDNHDAIVHALVDMIMLSRTPVVTASEYSTFSSISAVINGGTRLIIRDDGSDFLSQPLGIFK